MSAADIFTLLYPIVPLVAMIGYAPQLFLLFRTKTPASSVSISTWVLWTSAWIIGLGYALFAVPDFFLAVTAGMNALCHLLIIGLTLYKRAKYGGAYEPFALFYTVTCIFTRRARTSKNFPAE